MPCKFCASGLKFSYLFVKRCWIWMLMRLKAAQGERGRGGAPPGGVVRPHGDLPVGGPVHRKARRHRRAGHVIRYWSTGLSPGTAAFQLAMSVAVVAPTAP